jgi:Asp-tRNA(Asn)/Glu-tRNA(Gln) amidotransferase A subunit family amidase
MENTNAYELKSVKLPRLAGSSLSAFTRMMENPATRGLLLGNLLNNGGITHFRSLDLDSPPTFLPQYPWTGESASASAAASEIQTQLVDRWHTAPPGFTFATTLDYARAYREGETSPQEVALRVLDSIEATQNHQPGMNIFIAWKRDDILAQAEAAAHRIEAGAPLSVLDGVPVAVKDEVDQLPYPTTVGTSFLGKAPAVQDSTVVARVRAAGAVLIGKTNMHEIGIGVTGFNPHHGTARNPYNPNHHTGGSSSGSSAAVAAGFCPIAIGADGGGSIRIPSSFCGLVGLKATFGRVSEYGAAPLTWSMGHLGPIAATALDAALGYSFLAGPDPKDVNSLRHPPLTLESLMNTDLSGLRLGIYPAWFQHASPAIVEACQRVVSYFEKCGALLVEIQIAGLEAARVAHVITIISEMVTAMDSYYHDHHQEFAMDTRINLALGRTFTSRDYILAQQVRTQSIQAFESALAHADIILTPTTGITAPMIRPDAQPDGESDLSQLTEIMRFVTPANLTGHPAISFPAGHDPMGLPIGIQAIGRAWQEHLLLRLAYTAEQFVERQAPQVYRSPLRTL